MSREVKVSGTGWLCILQDSKWIPVFTLSEYQIQEWKKIMEPSLLASEQGLKVYIWTGMRSECPVAPNGSRQTHEVVAAKSLAAAARIAGMNASTFRRWANETGNEGDIRSALSEPGTIFWRPLNSSAGNLYGGELIKSGTIPEEWKIR